MDYCCSLPGGCRPHHSVNNSYKFVHFQVAACGVFAYATFSIIAGCLGDYRKPPNLVVMVTGIISIVQVPIFAHLLWHVIQLVFSRSYSSSSSSRMSQGEGFTVQIRSVSQTWLFDIFHLTETNVSIKFDKPLHIKLQIWFLFSASTKAWLKSKIMDISCSRWPVTNIIPWP